nr:methyl-accepting chemotaxis protein [Sphingobium lignivorans]
MALVKKATLAKRGSMAKAPPGESTPAQPSPSRKPRSRRATSAVDRIDQATQELASGLGEAAAAAGELQRAVDQISTGAEEAAGAAQESLGSISELRGAFAHAAEQAGAALRQTEMLQAGFSDAAMQIDASISAIALNARRQLGSVAIIERLEAAADRIAAVGETVSDISEQTGMLALNASIEAVRAGDGGKGFAIVADEVRELADTSDKSARDIRQLATDIVTEIRNAADRIRAISQAATREAANGAAISASLQEGRGQLDALLAGARAIAAAAGEATIAANEAERGAEQVASAAEEQSAAGAEAQQAMEQQAASLDQSQQIAEALGELTNGLEASEGDQTLIEQVATAAEQLSAMVQELSGASSQILVALEQIARGAQVQSAATLQASTAMAQIESSAGRAHGLASDASATVRDLVTRVTEARSGVGTLAANVSDGVAETRAVLQQLATAGATARKIEKIGDGLALVALQTNMLAVSGTVEASRAGEAGAGFATVTADIRKLAREGAANAEDAKDVVRSIQDQLATAQRDLDQSMAASEAEIGRNEAMIQRFDAMTLDLGNARGANEAILDRADAILRSATEVRQGCDQIAMAAELAATAAREAGSAAAQQAQVAEDLAAAIEDIAALAASLVGAQG